MPELMMAEVTSTFTERLRNLVMIFSSWDRDICPWATPTRARGTISLMRRAMASMVDTWLCTKNTCPPRMSSRVIAC